MRRPVRMPLSRVLSILLLGCLIAPASAQESDGLGRLFTTPQQRARLDRMRERKPRAAPVQHVGAVRLDGIVLRSDGGSTVWLNRQPLMDGGRELQADAHSVALPTGIGTQERLRVGESVVLPSIQVATP